MFIQIYGRRDSLHLRACDCMLRLAIYGIGSTLTAVGYNSQVVVCCSRNREIDNRRGCEVECVREVYSHIRASNICGRHNNATTLLVDLLCEVNIRRVRESLHSEVVIGFERKASQCTRTCKRHFGIADQVFECDVILRYHTLHRVCGEDIRRIFHIVCLRQIEGYCRALHATLNRVWVDEVCRILGHKNRGVGMVHGVAVGVERIVTFGIFEHHSNLIALAPRKLSRLVHRQATLLDNQGFLYKRTSLHTIHGCWQGVVC